MGTEHGTRGYEDLVARKVTSVAHLGVMGGSNGGLMVGNRITLGGPRP